MNDIATKIHSQVILAAKELTDDQRRQPEWLWCGDNLVTYGRWQRRSDQAPYIRADIAVAAKVPDPRDTIPAKMAEALKAFADAWGLGVAADRRMWEAAREALAEYEAWSGAKRENAP
jgi:hypothetical protein